MAYLWYFGIAACSTITLIYAYTFVHILRTPKAQRIWQQWAGSAFGLAACVFMLIDHIQALHHQHYSTTSDLRAAALVCLFCSILFIRKVVARRHA